MISTNVKWGEDKRSYPQMKKIREKEWRKEGEIYPLRCGPDATCGVRTHTVRAVRTHRNESHRNDRERRGEEGARVGGEI